MWSRSEGLPWWVRWWRICLQCGRPEFDPWIAKILWRRAWQPIPVFLPGESPWTEESSGLQSMGLQKVRHNWATKQTHYYFLVWSVVGCLGSFYMDSQLSQNLLLINPHFAYLSQILTLSHTEHLYMHKSFEFPVLFIDWFVAMGMPHCLW